MKSALHSLLVHGLIGVAAWLVVSREHGTPFDALRSGDGVALEWGRSARVPEPHPKDHKAIAPQAAPADPSAIALNAEPQAAQPTSPGDQPQGGSADSRGSGGLSDGNAESGPAIRDYRLAIRTRIESHLRYPLSLRRRGVSGTVLLALAIHATDGTLSEARLERGSGSTELDELALDAARRAAPFGKPTLAAAPQTGLLRFQVPVMFRVTQ